MRPAPAADHTPEPYAYLDQDLPAPRVVMDLTQRALADADATYRSGGFVGWSIAVPDCYEQLAPSDLQQRVYCLQFDAAVYAIEASMPQAFQEADAERNPYFTPDEFMQRQIRFAPPDDPSLSADALLRRKREVLAALAITMRRALADFEQRLLERAAAEDMMEGDAQDSVASEPSEK